MKGKHTYAEPLQDFRENPYNKPVTKIYIYTSWIFLGFLPFETYFMVNLGNKSQEF